MKRNELVIDGILLKRGSLRHTPAGLAAIDMLLGHRSVQIQAGRERRVQCEIEATAIGDIAVDIEKLKLNRTFRFSGFITQDSVGRRRLAMHVIHAQPIGDGGQD